MVNTADRDALELKKLDELVRWYEEYRPEAGRRIDVRMSPRALNRMLGRPPIRKPSARGEDVLTWPAEVEYRGRVLRATVTG
jgi:hypothetical protein